MLRAEFKKTEILKLLNVSKITVHRVEQRLKASNFLEDSPRSGRPQVLSQETIKKAFENGPCQKNYKTGTEPKDCSHLCVQDGQKDDRK